MARVVQVIRHAAPPEAVRGRYWGHADPGVDPAALAAVGGTAASLSPRPQRLLASPLERARLTAAEVSRILSLPAETVPDLAEADFGRFDGLTFPEIEARFPEAAAEWCRLLDSFTFPGGESAAGFLSRAEKVWRFCTALPEDTVAVVTHGGIIMSWFCLFLGRPPAERFTFRLPHGAAAVFARPDGGPDAAWEMTACPPLL